MLKFVLLTAALVAATKGEGCCTPDQWEGIAGSLTGFVKLGREEPAFKGSAVHRMSAGLQTEYDGQGAEDKLDCGHRVGRVGGYSFISYDFTNERSAAYANYSARGRSRAYRMVTREGKRYVVDLQSKKCYQKTLTSPFRQACIPDSAREMPPFSLGNPDNSVAARNFMMKIKVARKYDLDVSASVTSDGCIPLSALTSGYARGVSLMETRGYINITAGISDPGVFSVPSECKGSNHPISAHPEITEYFDRDFSILGF